MFPKSQKLSPNPASLARQDTIDETNEDSKSLRRSALERQTSENAIGTKREKVEKASSIEREMVSVRTTSASETYDNGLREQTSSLAQRDIIATVLEMKSESRQELQVMSQRIGRLEDLLTGLVKSLNRSMDSSDLSTPADENIPTITTTFVGSPSTSSNAQSTNINVTSTASTSAAAMSMMQPSSSSGNFLLFFSMNLLNIFSLKTKYKFIFSFILQTGLPILLRKRRSKSRRAPAPPTRNATSPEQARLLDDAETTASTSTPTTSAAGRH